jgi:hypothetical protein
MRCTVLPVAVIVVMNNNIHVSSRNSCLYSIPHEKLLKEVARRIVDKNILRLIKM